MVEHRDRERRILEIEYQTLNQEITTLLESRAFERRSVEEINRLWLDLSSGRIEDDLLHHLAHCESLLSLHVQTSNFRNHYRRLQSRMAELGQRLGYW